MGITNPVKKAWDMQYAGGLWEYLRDDLEKERFMAVLQSVKLFSVNGKVLEIGCGEGILQSRMQAGSYVKYVGIDISEVAIKKTAHLCNSNTQYICADMEKYSSDEKYDLIIFNESLYYSNSPLQLLERYVRFLQPCGHFIISVFKSERNMLLLNSIESHCQHTAEQISTNERGSWYCRVYSRKNILAG